MKGLIYKDLQLMLKSKKISISFLFILIYGSVFPQHIMFVLSFITMVFCFLGFNSLSFEEFDNSVPYMITMPITRKQYVREKYWFSILFTTGGWLISTLICFLLQSEDVFLLFFIQALAILLSMILFQIVLIPIQIKYGSEMSRIVLFAIMGIILGICAFIARILNSLEVTEELITKMEIIWNNIMKYGGIVGFLIFVLIIIISYKCSIKFFCEKEF